MKGKLRKAVGLLALVAVGIAVAVQLAWRNTEEEDYLNHADVYRAVLDKITEDIPHMDKMGGFTFVAYNNRLPTHPELRFYAEPGALTYEELCEMGYALMERIDRYVNVSMEEVEGRPSLLTTGEFLAELSVCIAVAPGKYSEERLSFRRYRVRSEDTEGYHWSCASRTTGERWEVDGFYTYPLPEV